MSAVISPCGQYRYRLDRTVAMEGPVYAFFGINPSTADASLDDATVRKWIGFTKKLGGSRFMVGNVFAYRSTDVKALGALKPSDAIGLMNDWHLMRMAVEADVIVPCWGNTSKVPPAFRERFKFMAGMLTGAGKPLHCFGLTNSGDPKHPLMLGYDTPLIEFAQEQS